MRAIGADLSAGQADAGLVVAERRQIAGSTPPCRCAAGIRSAKYRRSFMSIYGCWRACRTRLRAGLVDRSGTSLPASAGGTLGTGSGGGCGHKYDLALAEAHQAVALRPDWDIAVTLEAQLWQRKEPPKGAELLKQFWNARR